MKKYLILGCALILVSCIWSVQLTYKISSLGLKVADLSINLGNNNMHIHAENTTKNLVFPHINNHYYISFDDYSKPLSYLRIIHQDSLKDSVIVSYAKADSVEMWQKSINGKLTYPAATPTRDVFSLLFYLTKHNAAGEYILDGNGIPWKAIVQNQGQEITRTSLGKFSTTKYQITFQRQTNKKTPYIDMLTHNILSEDSALTLFVSADGIPVKATIKKNKLGMTWDLLSVKK